MKVLLLLTIPTVGLLAFLTINGFMPPPFVITSTRYAPGYSHSSFRKMQVGTPIQTVRDALGEPLRQFTNESRETCMIYSFHKGGRTPFYFQSCWFKSRILVASNGVVVERISFINFD